MKRKLEKGGQIGKTEAVKYNRPLRKCSQLGLAGAAIGHLVQQWT